MHVPKAYLTVDEELLGYRDQIPGLTYIPSKPQKYGLKIFGLAEAASGFALNAKLHIGRENNSVHRNLGCDVVMELRAPYYKTN